MKTPSEQLKITQARIVDLFQNVLGYRYFGTWEDHNANECIDVSTFIFWLNKRGYDSNQIARAAFKLGRKAHDTSKEIYTVNREVYYMLRHGVNIELENGKYSETIHIIDWKNPLENDFAIAEDVNIDAPKNKLDMVIYVNGIALAVLELKESSISISKGIARNSDNQKILLPSCFFSTVQYVLAGNEKEGLVYAAIDSPEEKYIKLSEVNSMNYKDHYKAEVPLDKDIKEIMNKETLLDMIMNAIVYDKKYIH